MKKIQDSLRVYLLVCRRVLEFQIQGEVYAASYEFPGKQLADFQFLVFGHNLALETDVGVFPVERFNLHGYLAVVCKGMGDRLDSIGGVTTMLIAIAITASVSMCLPISTPPNAIAHSTGLVKQNEMLKVGIVIGIVGMVLGYFTLRLM